MPDGSTSSSEDLIPPENPLEIEAKRVSSVFLMREKEDENGEIILILTLVDHGEKLIHKKTDQICIYRGTDGNQIILEKEGKEEKIDPEDIIYYRRNTLKRVFSERERAIIWYDVNGKGNRIGDQMFAGQVWG